MKSDFWRSWSGYYVLVYLIILTCSALFLTEVREWSAGTLLLLLVEVPVYALGYTLPGAVLSGAVGGALCRSLRRSEGSGFVSLSCRITYSSFNSCLSGAGLARLLSSLHGYADRSV